MKVVTLNHSPCVLDLLVLFYKPKTGIKAIIRINHQTQSTIIIIIDNKYNLHFEAINNLSSIKNQKSFPQINNHHSDTINHQSSNKKIINQRL